MTRCDVRWLRRFLLAGLGLAVAGACSTPEFNFVPEPTVEHCANEFFDAELGETDIDCGGSDCKACDLGQGCIETIDCFEGQCVDGYCQAEGCDNGAEDEGETDIDCGGGSCRPCDPGQGCLVARDCESKSCSNGTCAESTCDDGIINGTETGRDCGGGICPEGCGTGSPCNDNTDCRSMLCAGEPGTKRCELSCLEGTADCNGEPDDECETNLLTDALHCGDCETVCELAHAEQSCVSSACQIGACNENYDDCNNDVEDGCETNLLNSAADCGSCGMECSDDNGTPSCASSECQIDCDEGFEDCDDDRGNGCERSVASDVEACGDCTTVCPIVPGETPWCRDGICGGTPCLDGTGNCDGVGETCEKDLTSDTAHCGRCGGACTVRNGTPRCNASVCAVQSCEDGWDNCDTSAADGGYANGCETNTDVDVANCGSCGNDCTVLNGAATCVAGQCRVMSCNSGWFNCDSGNSDGGYANGCETNIDDDKLNCGACGRSCDTVFAPGNATGQCTDGMCERDQCLPNFGDCDTNPDICESDFRTDEGDCGRCGTVCSPAGTTGSPGNACLAGTCTPTCDANHLTCDNNAPNGCEVDRRSDESNCGTCGTVCQQVSSVNTCTAGACVPACDATHRNCDGDPNDGCETTIAGAGNETHCGGCAATTTTCTATGAASTACNASGVCVPDCQALRGDCDSEPWDGCETNFVSNASHCGACGRACQTGSGSPAFVSANTCSAGAVCQPTCVAGRADCDNEPWDGCEADITSITRCGSCMNDCAGTACGSGGDTSCCVASGGTYRCQAAIAQQGAAAADGVVGPTLTLMHNLTVASGSNRMVVVGVVARAITGGIAQARPDTVTYNGVAMTAGPEFDGGAPVGNDGQGHVFFYFMNNATLPGTTGTRPVVIDGAPGTLDPTVVTAMAVTLTGVRQSNPLSASIGNAFGVTCATTQPSSAVPIATTGSVILSMSGAQYPGAGSPTGSLTMLMDNEPSEDSTMKAMGGIRGHTSQLASPGSPYTVGWSYAWCAQSVHFAIVVHPAQQ